MFKKVLIANRGEIAIRIMSTCREMGIQSVAIYSAADWNALHTRYADEAYFIGPAPAAQSYLRVDKILDVAKQSGAEAIHPGYGFLSENAHFVEECKKAGIVFIGPPASAMRIMGSKIAAKQLAQSVGAPTIPGYDGEDQEASMLVLEAQRIGFPLLIKASAGGGGKGMRVVNHLAEFEEHLAGARREALASFGDATIFLERLLQKPRHIEIQVLGDTFGNLIHLGERECSIQRRHQKIVEESPSIALTPALREEMGTTAVRIAKAAGYVNAGTLEFLLDTDNQFYFLEMNTRLQVEHAVTELVTGIDLVRHQLQIAAEQPLDLTQEQINARGHAIEVRLYAEDPENNFLPSTGTVTRFIKPEGPGIRVDSGIESNDEISQFYDPMIAKLIVYGENRTVAIERLQSALRQQAIFGVKTNAQLLLSIATHPAFQAGTTFTNFLEEYDLLKTEPSKPVKAEPVQGNSEQENLLLALIAAAISDVERINEYKSLSNGHDLANPWQALGPWRMASETRRTSYTHQGVKYQVALSPSKEISGAWLVQVETWPSQTILSISGNNDFVLLRIGTNQIHAHVRCSQSNVQVILEGRTYTFEKRQPPNVDEAAHGTHKTHSQKVLTAPMAGTIIKVQVRDGER
ncbi:MAG TPA: acetyl-CoA carboxylase biotin carboxylase subunit, partial [Ktedonobacteraceae bacterium]|nr:acetyl-CoA carboxylase biotin carboxylase subunit [Ktedonobacteraceae bacterium]